MTEFSIHIEGLKELDRKLQHLGRKGARRALAKGLRQGANVVKNNARERARVKSGKLKKSIKVKNEGLKHGDITFSVGTANPVAHLIEYGHLLVKGGPLNGGGHVVGWVPAYPFLRPAAESNAGEAVKKVRDVTIEAIAFELVRS